MAEDAITAYELNVKYDLLTFLLLTVYHLSISDDMSKDRISRNFVWNLSYGGDSRYI